MPKSTKNVKAAAARVARNQALKEFELRLEVFFLQPPPESFKEYFERCEEERKLLLQSKEYGVPGFLAFRRFRDIIITRAVIEARAKNTNYWLGKVEELQAALPKVHSGHFSNIPLHPAVEITADTVLTLRDRLDVSARLRNHIHTKNNQA